jgi:hypothetical protein
MVIHLDVKMLIGAYGRVIDQEHHYQLSVPLENRRLGTVNPVAADDVGVLIELVCRNRLLQ